LVPGPWEGTEVMARHKVVGKQEIMPDPVYNDVMVAKFVNFVMRKGKRSLAESIIYDAFDIVREKTQRDPLEVFKRALANVRPVLEVKSRRVGGSTYQVPVEVRPERRNSLALRWIIQHAKQRAERSMREGLAAELVDAANNTGASVKKKEDTHKMAEANKAFSHFRW